MRARLYPPAYQNKKAVPGARSSRHGVNCALALVTMMLSGPLVAGEHSNKTVLRAIEKAEQMMVSDPSAALRLAREAERLSTIGGAPADRDIPLATALWLQSEAKLRSGDGDRAIPLIRRAMLAIGGIDKPLKLRGDLLLTRGGWQVEQNQPAQALASFQDAHREFARAGESRGRALALQNIAVLYTGADDFERANRYYQNSAEVYSGDPQLALFTSLNRGVLLYQMERYAEAAAASRSAARLARDVGSLSLEITAQTNLARALLGLGDIARARLTLNELRQRLPSDPPAIAVRKIDIVEAQVEQARGNLVAAERLISSAFADVDLDTTPIALRDAHFTAYSIYQVTGQAGLALRHLAAERRLATEANRVAISTGAALMAARFDFANQELRIANLKAAELRRSIAFEREEAADQRRLFAVAAGAAAMLLALLTFGLVTIRRSRNQVRDANIVLGRTNVELEKALRAKTEFLATTSHEIRTPLNGILGMTQVILADARIDPATRDRIGIVHGAGLTMRSLVDDILDVAKMETGNLTVDPVPMDLRGVLREVCRIWEEQARGKGIVFRLDVDRAPGWIRCDPDRLRQIVFNLCSNAIKFTAAGEVTVVADRDGDDIRIAVRDSGIGIPPDRLADIFESFRQVDAGTTRQFGGTGLGLTISRNLARALGGDITVTSEEGVGACFTICLPYHAVEPPTVAATADVRCGVAVLERNPIARAMLKTVLEPRCGSVRFAATVQELLTLLDQDGTDRILVEEATLKTAGGELEALLVAIAAAARDHGASLTLLWTAPDEADMAAIARVGIERIIVKPVSGSALAAQLVPETEGQPTSRLVSQAA